MYVTCNTLPRNGEIERLPGFLEAVEDAGADGLIVTDLGVLALAKRYAPRTEVHISTQAGIVNYQSARAFYDLGASRVVLARELSLEEIAEIRAKPTLSWSWRLLSTAPCASAFPADACCPII